jgi:uncharacterized damage-inducible protein DinB
MERRLLLTGMAAAPAAFSQSSAAGWSNIFAKTWQESFIEHWRDTTEYTLAVLDAMPADAFDTRPNPEQRPFGDQLKHLASANIAYFRAFGLVPAPEATDASPTDKDAVRKFVSASFDYVSAVLAKLTERDLARKDLVLRKGAAPHSGTDICMRAYMHTAHHRGQAVVYLRVKGITPPAWKFEPTTG